MFKRLGVFAILLSCPVLTCPAPVRAEPATRDRLIFLFKIMASTEECEFPIDRREAKAVSDAAIAIVQTLHLREEEADRAFEETRARLDREGWEKLCNPQGVWAATWRETIKTLSTAPD